MISTACVVGGGIAGLAAAHRLARAGVEVTLFEPARLGGRIRTTPFAGREVDEGADAFLARVPHAVELAVELGLTDELVSPAARNAYLYVDEELRPLPAQQVLGIPTDLNDVVGSRILTRAGIAALRHEVDFGADPLDGPDVAIGPYLRSRVGEEVTDRLVAPLVGGINAGDIDRLSLAAVTPQLDAVARGGKRSMVRALAAQRRAVAAARAAGEAETPVFLAPRSGMGRLVGALVERLHRLGVAVETAAATELRPVGSTWELATASRTFATEAVVVATPAPVSAGLLATVAPVAAEVLRAIRYAGVVLVTFAFDPPAIGRALDGSGFLVPRSSGLLLTAASWSSSKWAHLAGDQGDGTVLVRASAGRAGDERALELSDDEIVDRLTVDLSRAMQVRSRPAAARISRHPGALAQYEPGHLEGIARAEAALAAAAPGVVLAGASLRGVGIPACIASGHAAADHLLGTGATR